MGDIRSLDYGANKPLRTFVESPFDSLNPKPHWSEDLIFRSDSQLGASNLKPPNHRTV